MDGRTIPEKLNDAWDLFDSGDAEASRALYRECLRGLTPDARDLYVPALMGLVYAESACRNFRQAGDFASELLELARDHRETHVFLHQAGMVERMAGRYTEAMELFLRERELLLDRLPDEQAGISANFYETGYVSLLQARYEDAERDLRYSLEMGRRSGDSECTGCAYRGLGELYGEMGDGDRSREMYQKAAEAFGEAGDLSAVREVEDRMKRSGLPDC